MKKVLSLVAVLLLFVVVSSSSVKKELPSILNVTQRFVKVDERLYADKYEVTVQDYQIFLEDKQNQGVDCTSWMYDSTLMGRDIGLGADHEAYYFNYSCHRNYPILCITHVAANEFCRWLTEKYQSNPDNPYKKVVFRLPSEEEFIKAASSIYDHKKICYPWGNGWLFEKGEKRCNFYNVSQEYLDLDTNTGMLMDYRGLNWSDHGIESVLSYKPNPYGIYNIVGNAAEMIQEEHIAMGGDWKSTGYNVQITSKKRYEDKGTNIGFRVYMEIVEF